MSYVCNMQCYLFVFHVCSALVFLKMWLEVYLHIVPGDSSYMSCAVVMNVYGVGPFLFRIDDVYVQLSSV
jgi:hypothetical protein